MPPKPFSRNTTTRACPAFGGPSFRTVSEYPSPLLAVSQPHSSAAATSNTSPRNSITPPDFPRAHANGKQRQVATGRKHPPPQNMQPPATPCVLLQLLHVHD